MPSTNIVVNFNKVISTKRAAGKAAKARSIRNGAEVIDYSLQVERLSTAKAVEQCHNLIEAELSQHFERMHCRVDTLVQKLFTPSALLVEESKLVADFVTDFPVIPNVLINKIQNIIQQRFDLGATPPIPGAHTPLDYEPMIKKIQSLAKTYRFAWVVGQVIDNIANSAGGRSSQAVQAVYGCLSLHSALLKGFEIDDASVGQRCRHELQSSLQGGIENMRLQATSQLSHTCAAMIYDLHDRYVESRTQVAAEEFTEEEAQSC